MNLYLLRRIEHRPIYDVCNGFVIRASDADAARRIASCYCGDEGADVWQDPERSSCADLYAEIGNVGIVLCDFNAG